MDNASYLDEGEDDGVQHSKKIAVRIDELVQVTK